MSMGTRGSNGRTSNQDYTNLLFSDSDSDSRIPDLKLPPVKGKRQKKKRGISGYRSDETSCGVGGLMKVTLFLVLFTVIIALGGISFWSMKKISSLQEKVDKLEQSDAFTPDSMTKFQSQLVSLNKTLTDLRLGAGGMKASIETLGQKVISLEDKNVELQSAVSVIKDVSDLPVKFASLTSTVVDMKNVTTITSKRVAAFEKRMSALENYFKTTTTKRPDTGMTEETKSNDIFAEQLKQLNETVEEFISHSATSSPVATTLIKQMIKDAMLEYVSNMTLPDAGSGSSLPGEMEGVLKQVDGIVKDMKEFKTDIVTKGEYLLFKEDVMTNFKNLNNSLLAFNDELDTVSDHFQMLDSHMENITNFIKVVGTEITNDDDDDDNDDGGDDDDDDDDGGSVQPTPAEAGRMSSGSRTGDDRVVSTTPRQSTEKRDTTTNQNKESTSTIVSDAVTDNSVGSGNIHNDIPDLDESVGP